MDYNPASLPLISDVQVVPLNVRRAPDTRPHRKRLPAGAVSVVGAAAQEVAALFRGLPPYGFDTMCHDPPFELRFFDGERLVLEASLCWMCNNARGTANSEVVIFNFDAGAPGSRLLLAKLDAICPGRTLE